MKKTATLLALLLITSITAQRTDFGPVKECFSRHGLPYISMETEDQLFLRSNVGETKNLICVNKKDFSVEYDASFEMETEFGVVETSEGSGFFNGDFAIFNSFFHRKEDRFDLKMTTVDTEAGVKKSDKILWSKKTEKNKHRGFYRVITNSDGNRILIHTSTYYKSRDVTEEKLILLDDELDVVVQKDLDSKGENDPQIRGLLFDLEGSIFYFQNNEIVMLDAFNNYEEWREPIAVSEVEVDGEFRGQKATFDDNYDLVVTAFYLKEISEEERDKNSSRGDDRTESIEGIFYQKVSGLKKETVVSRLLKFEGLPEDREEEVRNVTKGLNPERMANIELFFKDNGDFALTFEEYDRRVAYSRSGGMSADYQKFGDIGIFMIEADGNLSWVERIGRHQTYKWGRGLGFVSGSHGFTFLVRPGDTYNYFSYGGYFDDDRFYIAFNDHEDNRSRDYNDKEPKKFKKVKHSVPVLYSFDKDGRKKRKIMRKLERGELRFVPSRMFYSEYDNKVYFFNQDKDEYCLVEMKI